MGKDQDWQKEKKRIGGSVLKDDLNIMNMLTKQVIMLEPSPYEKKI